MKITELSQPAIQPQGLPVYGPEQAQNHPEIDTMPPEREAALRRILDPPYEDERGNVVNFGNFEYARDSGLIDMFEYDPDGRGDGLMHLLVGDVKIEEGGKRSVEGFHIVIDPDYTKEVYGTFENTGHLENANSERRKKYFARPFEPRIAQVTVRGYNKTRIVEDGDGNPVVAPVTNNMFPHEYDAMTAMQAIRIARDSRDRTQDQHIDGKIVNKSSAPMIDGETRMPITVVMNEQEKVITAIPAAKNSGYMKLSGLAIDKVLGLK